MVDKELLAENLRMQSELVIEIVYNFKQIAEYQMETYRLFNELIKEFLEISRLVQDDEWVDEFIDAITGEKSRRGK